MTKKAFDKIAEGLNEAISAARGEPVPGQVPAVLQLKDVAAHLGVSPRWLVDFLRANPTDALGRPLFKRAGRVRIFTPEHVERIIDALPAGKPPPARDRLRPPAPRSRLGQQPQADTWDHLQALLAKSPRRR